MNSLEYEIEGYAVPTFSAEVEARNFFASANHDEVSKRKRQLEVLAASIDNTLKDKVRANYGLFLQANEEIGRLGKDMNDLQQLITNTQRVIDEIKSNRSAISGGLTRTSEGGGYVNRAKFAKQSTSLASAGASSHPSWVTQAAIDIGRALVEQNFTDAVQLVINVRLYFQKTNSSSNETQMAVEDHARRLSKALRKSLQYLPVGQLWGQQEQLNRLNLLIVLGHPNLAAEAFAKHQPDITAKCFNIVEVSGNTTDYISNLCHAFFATMRTTVIVFQRLFPASLILKSASVSVNAPSVATSKSDNNSFPLKEETSLISYLVDWIFTQVDNFVSLLCRQILIGINEKLALTLSQLNSSLNITENHDPVLDISLNKAQLDSIKINIEKFIFDLVHHNKERKIDVSGVCKRLLDADLPSRGALGFLSHCASTLFYTSYVNIDRLGIQVSSICRHRFVPEIARFAYNYIQEISKEMQFQVQQDDWNGIFPSTITIQTGNQQPILVSKIVESNLHHYGVGASFHWTVNALNYLMKECGELLRLNEINENSLNNSNIDDIVPDVKTITAFIGPLSSKTASGTDSKSQEPLSKNKKFIRDLMQKFSNSDENDTSKTKSSDSGSKSGNSSSLVSSLPKELVELQLSLLSSLVQIFIRFIIGIETTVKDRLLLTTNQQVCLANTLSVIYEYTLPSFSKCMWQFFSPTSQSTHINTLKKIKSKVFQLMETMKHSVGDALDIELSDYDVEDSFGVDAVYDESDAQIMTDKSNSNANTNSSSNTGKVSSAIDAKALKEQQAKAENEAKEREAKEKEAKEREAKEREAAQKAKELLDLEELKKKKQLEEDARILKEQELKKQKEDEIEQKRKEELAKLEEEKARENERLKEDMKSIEENKSSTIVESARSYTYNRGLSPTRRENPFKTDGGGRQSSAESGAISTDSRPSIVVSGRTLSPEGTKRVNPFKMTGDESARSISPINSSGFRSLLSSSVNSSSAAPSVPNVTSDTTRERNTSPNPMKLNTNASTTSSATVLNSTTNIPSVTKPPSVANPSSDSGSKLPSFPPIPSPATAQATVPVVKEDKPKKENPFSSQSSTLQAANPAAVKRDNPFASNSLPSSSSSAGTSAPTTTIPTTLDLQSQNTSATSTSSSTSSNITQRNISPTGRIRENPFVKK